MKINSVAAIIVNWNSSHDTVECIAHLRNLCAFRGTILIVDNGSAASELASLGTIDDVDTTILPLPLNRGYGAGVNAGIDWAAQNGIGWVWLTNPDSRPEPSALNLLRENLHGAVVLGPSQWSGGVGVNRQGRSQYVTAAILHQKSTVGVRCTGCKGGSHPVDVVTGTGLLMSVRSCKSIGSIDERFFHYKEEFDFVRRLSTLGEIRYVCVANVWHRRGGSLSSTSPTAEYYRVRNELLYLDKLPRFTVRWVRKFAFSIRSLFNLWSTLSNYRVAHILGLFDGMRSRGGQVRWHVLED